MTRGPSRPTLYSVKIPKFNTTEYDYIQIFCKSVSIPGISQDVVTTLGQEYMGVQRTQPAAIRFGGPLILEVIENGDFSMYKAFRRLFDETAIGSNPGNGSSVTAPRTQRMNFYETYTFNMALTKLEFPNLRNLPENLTQDGLNNAYREVQSFEFQNCYATSISEIGLGSDMFNQMLTFRVAFNYETYYTSNGSNT